MADYAHIKDRCERYAARLDDALAKEPSDRHRRGFLDRELAKWIDRYETFQRDVHADQYTGDATVFDYLITLADIQHRRAQYAPVKAGD